MIRNKGGIEGFEPELKCINVTVDIIILTTHNYLLCVLIPKENIGVWEWVRRMWVLVEKPHI